MFGSRVIYTDELTALYSKSYEVLKKKIPDSAIHLDIISMVSWVFELLAKIS